MGFSAPQEPMYRHPKRKARGHCLGTLNPLVANDLLSKVFMMQNQ